MITKTIRCPNCNNTVTVNGSPGEKVEMMCSVCNKKGAYIFQTETVEKKTSTGLNAIEVTNLTKKYNSFKAVDNISFSVKKGEIFGFLGPNGAGKTTTIKSLLDLIQINSGEIQINNFNVKKQGKQAKKYIGYLPEQVAFYDNLTARQNMFFYAELKNATKEECISLINEFGLGDSINKKVGKFSKGMKQRLGMARAILGNPPILILDEPSGGLDPRGVILIRNKIKEMRNNGSTIFVSSHILSEIQEICDRVGIIHNGVIVAKDSVSNLGARLNLKPKLIIELKEIPDKLVDFIKKVEGVESVKVIGKMMHIVCNSKTKASVILAIEKNGGTIINLQTKDPSLEEVFMRYTEGET